MAVLRRYLRERVDGSFGIYVDSEIGGQVARISGDLSPWASLALDEAEAPPEWRA